MTTTLALVLLPALIRSSPWHPRSGDIGWLRAAMLLAILGLLLITRRIW